MFRHASIQVITLSYVKRKILHALKDVHKEFFFCHAETARFPDLSGRCSFPHISSTKWPSTMLIIWEDLGCKIDEPKLFRHVQPEISFFSLLSKQFQSLMSVSRKILLFCFLIYRSRRRASDRASTISK